MGITCKPFGETKKFFQKHLKGADKGKSKFFKKSNEETKDIKKKR